MRLLLIRHGQTPSNVRDLLDTEAPGPGLTALGEAQALALAQGLSDEPIGSLFASNLTRAQLTATPMGAELDLPITVRRGIREVEAGDLEMRGDRDSIERYMSTIFAWSHGELDRRIPGGESGRSVLSRFDEVVDEAAETDAETVALVSHGAAIRFWCAARVENVSPEFVARNGLGNTGIVVLEGKPTAGWHGISWMGEALGGPVLDRGEEGPTGEAYP